MIGQWWSWDLNPDLLVPESVLLVTVESHLPGELCKRTDSWMLLLQGSIQESVCLLPGGDSRWQTLGSILTHHIFLLPGLFSLIIGELVLLSASHFL